MLCTFISSVPVKSQEELSWVGEEGRASKRSELPIVQKANTSTGEETWNGTIIKIAASGSDSCTFLVLVAPKKRTMWQNRWWWQWMWFPKTRRRNSLPLLLEVDTEKNTRTVGGHGQNIPHSPEEEEARAKNESIEPCLANYHWQMDRRGFPTGQQQQHPKTPPKSSSNIQALLFLWFSSTSTIIHPVEYNQNHWNRRRNALDLDWRWMRVQLTVLLFIANIVLH